MSSIGCSAIEQFARRVSAADTPVVFAAVMPVKLSLAAWCDQDRQLELRWLLNQQLFGASISSW
jgi:hypothetical protein